MTVNDMKGAVGRIAVLRGDLYVDVLVLDAKSAYGRVRYLVAPLSGMGEIWADEGRVTLSDITASPAEAERVMARRANV